MVAILGHDGDHGDSEDADWGGEVGSSSLPSASRAIWRGGRNNAWQRLLSVIGVGTSFLASTRRTIGREQA